MKPSVLQLCNRVGEGGYLEIQPQEVINDVMQLSGSAFLITSQCRSEAAQAPLIERALHSQIV